MSYRILGPLQAHGPSGPVLLASRAERALLTALLLEPGRTVPVDRLPASATARPDGAGASGVAGASGASGPSHPADAATALERSLALAGAPAGVLVRDAAGYRLDAPPDEIDAERFAARAAAGRRALAAGDARTAAAELEAALAEWAGEPLGEFAGEPFAGPVIADLENLHAEVVQDRAEARLALGDVGWCVGELAGLVREMPYRERLWELYATALCEAGRPADALAAVRRVRDLLDEELGLEPGPGLVALERTIRDR
jgi:DNA-binding SARP family transcriptional activator